MTTRENTRLRGIVADLRHKLCARFDPGVGPHAFVPREESAELLCRALGAETVLLIAFYSQHTGFATWARDPDVCPRTQETARSIADMLDAGSLISPMGSSPGVAERWAELLRLQRVVLGRAGQWRAATENQGLCERLSEAVDALETHWAECQRFIVAESIGLAEPDREPQ